MIKKLLLLTALLAPALAYGANPSNDFSVQIVPAGSGSSSGNGGSSNGGTSSGGSSGSSGGGSPAAPAAALAGCSSANGGGPTNGSCFNTLAMNLDFTGATQSYVGSGPHFNAAGPVRNYIDCEGASTPSLLNGGHGPAYPCVDSNGVHLYSIAADSAGGGATSLVITATPSNSSGGGGSELYTANGYPAQFYVEYKVRTDAASQSSCNYSRSHGGNVCQDIWAYTDGTGRAALEYDFGEYYQNATNIDGGATWGGSNGIETHNWNSAPGIDVTQYAIFGERVTENGNGTVAVCWYFNNVQYAANGSPNCTTYNTTDPAGIAALSTSLSFLLQDGSDGTPVSSNMLLYIQWMRIWSCANWAQGDAPTFNGGACTGAVITSNP